MKKYINVPVVIILIVTAALIYWMLNIDKPARLPAEQAQSGTGGLTVSQSGSQIFTNVDASGLQQATPPVRSATNAELNPQQAVPNYCTAEEIPGMDGCIAPSGQ